MDGGPKPADRLSLGRGKFGSFSQNGHRAVALTPDVLLGGGVVVSALQEATNSIPIVFVGVPDPVGAGFVESLSRPGSQGTGFTFYEYGMSGKWLELLKEIAPSVKRVAVIRDTASPSGTGQLGALQSVAPSLGVELSPVGLRDANEVERTLTAFAGVPNSGLVVVGSTRAAFYRELIVSLAVKHRLPGVYPFRYFVTAGGLLSYGPDPIDLYRRAASYVDRILRGEKAADLPVQPPSKFDLIINLKTAKALGLTIPSSLLARADEVIE